MGELINLNSVTITEPQIPADIARNVEVASAIAAHNAADWVHLEYLYRVFVARDRSTQTPSTYVTSTEVTSEIASHVAEPDPHPTYLTQPEGDGRYRRSATPLVDGDIPAAIARDAEVASAIANHATAVNPHPIYIKCARINVSVTYNGTNLIQQLLGFHSSQVLGLTATCHMSVPSQNWVIPPGGYANGVPPIAGLPSQQVQTVGSNHYSLAAGSSTVQIILRAGAFNIGQVMTFKILAWYE